LAQAPRGTALSPLAGWTALRGLEALDRGIRAIAAASYVEARVTLVPPPPTVGGGRITFPATATPPVPRYSEWFGTQFGGNPGSYMDVIVQRHFRCLAERRVAAVSLACRLFRADHDRWPERLEELVPGYLPHVPADPFAEEGRPLGWVILRGASPGGADRPLVYFENTGKGEPHVGREPMYDWQEGLGGLRRQYRDVSSFVPPPPSTQAVDENP